MMTNTNETLVGLKLRGVVPEGYQPVEAFAVVKVVGEDGMRLITFGTAGLLTWEAVGMLRCVAAEAEAQFVKHQQENE